MTAVIVGAQILRELAVAGGTGLTGWARRRTGVPRPAGPTRGKAPPARRPGTRVGGRGRRPHRSGWAAFAGGVVAAVVTVFAGAVLIVAGTTGAVTRGVRKGRGIAAARPPQTYALPELPRLLAPPRPAPGPSGGPARNSTTPAPDGAGTAPSTGGTMTTDTLSTPTGEVTGYDDVLRVLGELREATSRFVGVGDTLSGQLAEPLKDDPASLTAIGAIGEAIDGVVSAITAAESTIRSRHEAMNEAVNATPHAAPTDFYRAS